MDILELVRAAASSNATDLQLVVGSPPLLRIYGELNPLNSSAPLTVEDVVTAFDQLATVREREAFRDEWELDFGYSVPGVGRLRCNAARQANGLTLSIRLLPLTIPTIDELGLPQIYKEFVHEPRGLLLISGPSDSGKSTTLAAMIQYLNEQGGHHIVTIEDPIEYVHHSIKSAITQRQLGRDTHSFGQALRHLLRQNPDVVMVGEMRDSETAAGVLAAAETGHLILSTGHAPSAPQAIERIVDMFPVIERPLAQARLASLLVAVACQALVPRVDIPGRIAAVEIMMANTAVRSLIRDGKIYQLANVIRSAHDIGMISLDESLCDLYQRQIIDSETLLAFCHDREEIGRLTGTIPKTRRTKRA
ncbi:MAG: PilT/PilU family type 4a pilus ATPase [Dehalococcoidales bacterium]|nr:PilT/PilU family type 4a pilus ATPase [Dehalococcoidales bacterium]